MDTTGTPNVGEVENFYDKRGENRLTQDRKEYGSDSLPLTISGPHRKMEEFVDTLPANSKILDLCCGHGTHSIYPAKLGHQVVGVDFSEKSVEAAQWLAKTHGVESNCQFLKADAMRFLADHQGRFDLVVISGSLYYFDLDKILPLIKNSLADGGTFICTGTSGSGLFGNLYRGLRQAVSKYRDQASVSDLLKNKDLKKVNSYFKTGRPTYHCFLTMGLGLVPRALGLRKGMQRGFSLVDKILLNSLGMFFLGFKFYFVGKK